MRTRVRLDWVTSVVRDTVDPSSMGDQLVDHYSIPMLEETGGPATQPASEIESGKQLLAGGEVLISRLNPRKARVLRPSLSTGRPSLCSGEFIVLQPTGVDGRFLEYVLLSESTRQYLDGAVQSVTRSHQRVRPEVLCKMWIGLPDLETQVAIAGFLDHETARIDALISAKKCLIGHLLERDEALVSHLGVPNSAQFTRLGHFATLQSGLTIDGSRGTEGEVVTRPYLRVANVQSDRIDLTTVTQVTVPRGIAERSTLRAGDVLMTEGGDLDKLGRGAVWQGQLESCLHQNHVFAIRPRPDRLLGEYLALLTRTAHARAYFESTGVKTTNLASTSASKILALPIPVLTIDEQHEIVRRYSAMREPIEHALEGIERQIGLLVEHRQALITAAVTGKVDIPGQTG